MDFQFGEKEIQLRKEIREFVKENIPPGYVGGHEEHHDKSWAFSMSISKKLAEKGWLTMTWPKEHCGRDASPMEQMIYKEEVGYWGIPGTTMGISGVGWVGPTLIMFGTEELKKKHIPLIASGEPDGVWCTGYSEPDAGSDFANLQTRAEKKGDHYVVNGQKVWTSCGHRSRWCWLAVRTNPDAAKKHHGISILIVDMESEGVTVRPLVNYFGFHTFNEVFFNDVKVPTTNLVGEENNGWYHLMHALGFERGGGAVIIYGACKRLIDELTYYVRQNGQIEKADIRHKLADLAVDVEALKMLSYESIFKMSKGMTIVYEPSRDKAFRDGLIEKISTIGTEIIGPCSQVDTLDKNSKWAKLNGRIEKLYWTFPGNAIAAGTTDNQKNIIAQFALQLPKSY